MSESSTRDTLREMGEHTAELLRQLRAHLDSGRCDWGGPDACEVCRQYPDARPADAAERYLDELASEVVVAVGTPLAVVLSGGGPTCEILRDTRGGPARWVGSWGGEVVSLYGDPWPWALDWFLPDEVDQ